MPRRRSAPIVIPTTSLVASATRYTGETARIYQPQQDWQKECYRHYAICGEARFAARFFGQALGKSILQVVKSTPDGPVVQTSGPGYDALTALFNGRDGQAQMLSAIGTHLTIAGECYLVGREVEKEDVWEVISTLEMHVAGTKWSISYANTTASDVVLKDSDVVIRIWNPHPARRLEADSPFRSLLPNLTEIEWLTKHIFSQVTSRLAGNGILFLPQEMTFPPPPDGSTVVNEADSFMLVLADGMMTPLEDPGSPAAKVPIVVTAPAEHIDRARWMTFWSELDSAAMELRQEAIRRFALGMDLPPEQVMGMSSNSGTGGGTSNGVSHWGAWQIEEQTIKLHIEPMLELIVNALTIGYLRPIVDDPSIALTYDTSALRLRPDRSKEALELFDRGVLSVEALLRETGFSVEDLPEREEFHYWLLRKVASGSATPEQVQAALAALGVQLGVPPTSPPDASPPRDARPAPSLEDHPTNPRTPAESALLAASEALVFRALERAGNRLRNSGAKPPNVPAYETHCYVRSNGNSDYLLSDAFSCAPQVLDGLGDVEAVVKVLESYCQTLMTEQSPHTRERLQQWLTLSEVSA